MGIPKKVSQRSKTLKKRLNNEVTATLSDKIITDITLTLEP